jgi:tRNA threonylcarbamoyl adenosine modification protein YeaZ
VTARASGLLAAAIDTASDLAGVALFEDSALLGQVTWRTRQNHSRELLPSLEWLLGRHARAKGELGGVCICLGPGSYAGMRVGISTAKALAYALDIPIAGVGRLEADALPLLAATPGRVLAVHAAGRAELAWAAYTLSGEIEPSALSAAPELLARIKPGDLVCGDLATLDAAFLSAAAARGARLVQSASDRVVAVGLLGQRKLAGPQADDAASLAPLYLRAPAIGPQPPR